MEMLLVMLIVGLLTSLIAPRFADRYARMEHASQRQLIEDQLRQLPRRARLLGHSIQFPDALSLTNLGDSQPPLSLPAGWHITFEPPLNIGTNGACSATTITLKFNDKTSPEVFQTHYVLTAPTCELASTQL